MTPRTRLVAATLGAVLVASAAWAGVAAWLHGSLRARARDTAAALEDLQSRVDLLQAQPVAQPAPARQEPTLLSDVDVPGTLHVLEELGESAGVEIAAKALPSANPGKTSFALDGRATPAQLCAFLAAIEASERLLVIESGRIRPGDEETVAFELSLSTFHATGGGQ